MGQQQQGQQGGADNAYAPIWIMVAIFTVGWLIWRFFKGHIVAAVFYVNLLQAKLISLFTNNLNNAIYYMNTQDPKTVSFDVMVSLSVAVGKYMRYPVLACLIALAIWLYFSNVTLKFRRTHSMQTLRDQEQYNWSQIMPVTKLNLMTIDINEGPWAMGLTPMEFAKKNDLLKRDDYAEEDPSKPGSMMTAGIRRGDAKSVLTIQLGPYFRGFEVLPIHLLALAAVFSARINRDRDAASELLVSINKSVLTGKIKFVGAKSLLKKHVNSEIVQKCAAAHAYVLTAMATLLKKARDDGVLATADFLWLKTVDRRAWYMLNSVGRQTPFVEVAGPFAHWKAELALGRKSIVPMVEEAIKALEAGIKEIKLSPNELEALK